MISFINSRHFCVSLSNLFFFSMEHVLEKKKEKEREN